MLYDVIVIGAGAVGALAARELSRYDLRVCLLERDEDVAMGTTRANSAIVHGGFDPVPGTLKARLNVRGTAMMPALAEQLQVPYRGNGSLVLAFSPEDKKAIEQLYQRGIVNGVPGLSVLAGEEVRALEPQVSERVTGALRCTSSGIVCPYELAIAAVGNAMDNGVELRTDFRVERIEKTDRGFCLYAGGEQAEGRYVLNCAGLYADEIAGMLGEQTAPIIPRRGEYLLLDKNAGGLVSHTLFQVPTPAGKGVLITPTVDGNLLIGPTSHEVASKENRDVTGEGLEEIRRAASRAVEDLPLRQVIRSFSGVRASLAGGDFVLRPSTEWPQFWHALGIDSPGLSAAPAIAEELVRGLAQAGLILRKKPDFRPERPSCRVFHSLDTAAKNRMIAEDPRYGHVICRCETVTEGEIVAAIHQNPPARTLDAVKRRTRTGMGRCQGGFCTPYLTEILAREWGIPEEAVMQFGSHAPVLTGRTKGGEEDVACEGPTS